jgi:hypothetical protein
MLDVFDRLHVFAGIVSVTEHRVEHSCRRRKVRCELVEQDEKLVVAGYEAAEHVFTGWSRDTKCNGCESLDSNGDFPART